MGIFYQPGATIIGALIAAFLGSLIGAWTALHRFRQERAFDRQLDWYERGVRSVNGLSEAISIALTYERDGEGNDGLWGNVQGRHLEVLRFANEAPIFATPAAFIAAEAARDRAQAGAYASNTYHPRPLPEPQRKQALEALDNCIGELNEVVRLIAAEARVHLRLKPLPRP